MVSLAGTMTQPRLADSADPDLAWIVRENLKKSRLSGLVAQTPQLAAQHKAEDA